MKYKYPKYINTSQKNRIRKYARNKLKRKNQNIKKTNNIKLYEMYLSYFGSDAITDFLNYEVIERKRRIERNKLKKGVVYVVGSRNLSVCKIGFSKNFKKRLPALQTGFPFKLEVLGMFEGSYNDEQQLHYKYNQYRINGEWFKLEGKLKESLKL